MAASENDPRTKRRKAAGDDPNKMRINAQPLQNGFSTSSLDSPNNCKRYNATCALKLKSFTLGLHRGKR